MKSTAKRLPIFLLSKSHLPKTNSTRNHTRPFSSHFSVLPFLPTANRD